MRDVITTVGGLIVVGLVVVATFLYGNQQREEQQREQAQQQQQQDQSRDQASVNQAQPSSPQQAKPEQPIQGGQKPATTAPGPAPASGRTPDTGGEILAIISLVAIALLYRTQQRSKQSLRTAALKT